MCETQYKPQPEELHTVSQPQIHLMHITKTSVPEGKSIRDLPWGIKVLLTSHLGGGMDPGFTPRSSHTLAWVPLMSALCLIFARLLGVQECKPQDRGGELAYLRK